MRDFALKVLTARPGRTWLFSVGQAGFILKSRSGQLLGIDLYLSDCVERAEGNAGFKRLLPRLLDPFELEFDAIVATHPHLDHFDRDAMPGLMSGGARLFTSVNCGTMARALELPDERIAYVRPGDAAQAGDFHLDFVSCDHGTGAPDAVGVVVTVDGKRVYEAGDTCLRLDRAEEYRALGPLDVMIAPINGAYGNLDEEACARLSGALNPRLTVPCHYGMFAAHGGNPGRFLEAMRRFCPGGEARLMCQGEGLPL